MQYPPTLDILLDRHAATAPRVIAFHFEGTSVSYADLAERVGRLANALTEAGIEQGDRLCYLGKNHPAFFYLLFACSRIGAVAVPLNWRLSAPEMAAIVQDSGARMLFVGAEFGGHVAGLDVMSIGVDGAPGMPALDSWIAGHSAELPPARTDDTAPVLQLYTSGTTGHPKGVMISQRNLLQPRALAHAAKVDWDQWDPQDVSLISMPLCHVSGTVCALMGLYHGATTVMLPAFDAVEMVATIEAYAATKIFVVPTALQMLVDHARASDARLGSVREIFYGASPIPESTLREAMEIFGDAAFAQQYGLTETSGGVVLLPAKDHHLPPGPRMRSAGKPMPGVEIRIAEANEAGDVGEVLVRSPANMLGYWNMPEETARAVDEHGWLHSGDAGYLDGDGYLYLHDRVKDMIISGGENIYPAEVESVLFGYADVDQVAVIGVPDERWGEVAKAMVVLKPGRGENPAGLLAWARERLAGYKLPKTVEYLTDLPRTASGKVMRRQLREPYWVGHDRRVN